MNKERDPYDLLTVEEILVEYKASARAWHWNAHRLYEIAKGADLGASGITR